ncbi:MAG: glycosyltransferase family 4 protein [Pirellulales bacterium]
MPTPDKPLCVATLLPNIHVGGPEIRMLNFAQAVDRNVIDYKMIVIGRSAARDRAHGSLRPQLVDAGVTIVDLDMPAWDDRVVGLHLRTILPALWKAWRTVWRIARTLRREKIDVLECHGHAPIVLGTLAAILAGKRYVFTAYDMYFWDRPGWRTPARLIFLLQRAMITDSRQRAGLMNEFFWRRIPTYVVPNGIHVPAPHRAREEVARELGIPLDRNLKFIGQVSRLGPDKGHLIAVEAAREVVRHCPDVAFLFCGYVGPRCPPDFAEQLRAKAREYGFGDRLFVFGYPGYIGDVFQLIDIQMHASPIDSSPISIHEGMALGKPAVGTDEGGIPELIIHEQSGLIVPKNDPPALAAALVRLVQEPDTAARFGAAARQRYEARHRPEIMARSLADVFLRVAGRPASDSGPQPI